ncbi:hypothetical protein ACV367_33575, partial [Pseudomonas aeruginosa]
MRIIKLVCQIFHLELDITYDAILLKLKSIQVTVVNDENVATVALRHVIFIINMCLTFNNKT